MTERVSSKIKSLIAERAGSCCEYCLSPVQFCPDAFSVEHIHPRALGGSAILANLAYSCQGCNNHKYIAINAKDSKTGQIVPLYNPREHRWCEHFRWENDFTIITGSSPIGRATVERLRLNRQEVVNLRCILRMTGIPPFERR